MATAGFLITLVAALIGSCFGKSKYYGRKDWERIPTSTNRIDVTLDNFDRQVLFSSVWGTAIRPTSLTIWELTLLRLPPLWKSWTRAA